MENVQTVASTHKNSRSVLSTISTWILLVMVSIVPFFFIPSAVFSFTFTKTILLSLGVLLPLLFWLISRLKEGKLQIPKGHLFLGALMVPLSYLLASLFSGVTKISIIGQGFETDTFIGILILFLLFFLVPIFFNRHEKITKIYFGLFISFIVVSVFQAMRLFLGVDFLSFGGLLSETTSNLVGKWNDLGVFFGLFTILFLTTLELLSPKGIIKALSYIGLVVSLAFTAVINFTAIWIVLGLCALFFFVYKILFRSNGDISENTSEWSITKFVSIPTTIVFVLSVLFVIMGGVFGEFITSKLNISQLEVRPSWGSTLEIGVSAIETDFLFGAGPNRFNIQWLLNKPEGINETVFWNTNFNSGIGFIPSTLTTTGVVGFASWAVFLILLLIAGVRGVLASGNETSVARYLNISSLLGTVFLWTFAIIYLPNVSVLMLTFLFTGVFISTQVIGGKISKTRISFIQNPKLGFVSVFVIVVAIIITVSISYVHIKRYVAFAGFQSALVEYNESGDFDMAVEKLERVISMSESDLFFRSMAQLKVVGINRVLSDTDRDEELARQEFQDLLADAITNASAATRYDARNYQNWTALGDIYGSLISLNVEGAYLSAMSAYNRALALNPHSPSLYLTLARVEAANEDLEKSREYIDLALKEKSNYTAAVFFLSQIDITEGKIDDAIVSTRAAATIAPNDPTLFFQLGLLYYNEKRFTDAVRSLERSVSLSPQYSNAKYFLGLTYNALERGGDAIAQFEEVSALNPDNEEVKLILANLREGKDPFDGAEPPLDTNPEERETLPIEETIPAEEV